MRAPRYLLREYAVRRLMRGWPAGYFLEVGYGGGHMLETLARWGHRGVGYDPSPQAREAAQQMLARQGITQVRLVEQLPESERFDYIFLFEVLGYFPEPEAELRRFRGLLKPGGRIVFSFVRQDSGYSREAVGDMRTFSAAEIDGLLAAAALKASAKWNYGFPLANLMRPAMVAVNSAWLRRQRSGAGSTGMVHTSPLMKIVGALVNRVTIWPWAAAQLLFRDTDLGNGYVVAAESA